MIDEDIDELGRFSDERAARLLAQPISRISELRWDADLVKRRLRECARDGERLYRAPGPTQKLTFWIDSQLFRGVSDFERNAWAEGVRQKTRIPDRPRMGMSDRQITRIEEALEWPMRYLTDYDDERNALKVWCWCEAMDESFSRFHRIVCEHRSTALRRRDRAFEIIMTGLLRDGVAP